MRNSHYNYMLLIAQLLPSMPHDAPPRNQFSYKTWRFNRGDSLRLPSHSRGKNQPNDKIKVASMNQSVIPNESSGGQEGTGKDRKGHGGGMTCWRTRSVSYSWWFRRWTTRDVNTHIKTHIKHQHRCFICFHFKGMRRNLSQRWIDFLMKKTFSLHPPLLYTHPPRPPPCCLHLKTASQSELPWQAGRGVLSCRGTPRRKGDGVSPAGVGQMRDNESPKLNLPLTRIMCPSIRKGERTTWAALNMRHSLPEKDYFFELLHE